jgi:adenylate kinase family enzyme
MKKCDAILLIGPTGSGKTPLGAYLESRGLWGKRCVHFDFGAQLRQIGREPEAFSGITTSEIDVIRHSLKTGALLEDKHFPIAAKILRRFIETESLRTGDFVILNGLPRHTGQARDVKSIVQIKMVIYLDCAPIVVMERIRKNAGGDRLGRKDDSLPAIENKLRIFHQRILPLLDYYRSQNVRVERIEMGVDTTPQDVIQRLEGTGRFSPSTGEGQ